MIIINKRDISSIPTLNANELALIPDLNGDWLSIDENGNIKNLFRESSLFRIDASSLLNSSDIGKLVMNDGSNKAVVYQTVFGEPINIPLGKLVGISNGKAIIDCGPVISAILSGTNSASIGDYVYGWDNGEFIVNNSLDFYNYPIIGIVIKGGNPGEEILIKKINKSQSYKFTPGIYNSATITVDSNGFISNIINGIAGEQVRTAYTCYVDSLYGNDSTAEINNPSKPFFSIQAAVNAASMDPIGGGLVIVNPGQYWAGGPGGNILRNGVHIFFHQGAVLNSVGGNNDPVFNASPVLHGGVTITNRTIICGYGHFIGGAILSVGHNPNSNIIIECNSITTNPGIQPIKTFDQFGKIDIRVRDNINTGDRSLRIDGNGIINVNANTIHCSSTNQFAWTVYTLPSFEGELNIKAKTITRANASGVSSTLDLWGNSCRVNIELDEIFNNNSLSNWGYITLYGKVYLNLKVKRAEVVGNQHLINTLNSQPYVFPAVSKIEIENCKMGSTSFFINIPTGLNITGRIIINDTECSSYYSANIYLTNSAEILIKNSYLSNLNPSGIVISKMSDESLLSIMTSTLISAGTYSIINGFSQQRLIIECSKSNKNVDSLNYEGNLYVNSNYIL